MTANLLLSLQTLIGAVNFLFLFFYRDILDSGVLTLTIYSKEAIEFHDDKLIGKYDITDVDYPSETQD